MTTLEELRKDAAIKAVARGVPVTRLLGSQEFTDRYLTLMRAWRDGCLDDEGKDAGLDFLLDHQDDTEAKAYWAMQGWSSPVFADEDEAPAQPDNCEDCPASATWDDGKHGRTLYCFGEAFFLFKSSKHKDKRASKMRDKCPIVKEA
jgi:hypothetical protein